MGPTLLSMLLQGDGIVNRGLLHGARLWSKYESTSFWFVYPSLISCCGAHNTSCGIED